MPSNRRDFLRGLAALTGASAGATLMTPRALAQQAADPRFLIVIGATGGGSILSGPLALRESEVGENAPIVDCFPDSVVQSWDGSPFRAADMSGTDIGQIPTSWSVKPSEVLARRREDLMVATWTRTSVNHAIGQKRAVTGNEAWRGRTMQEAVAWQYGYDAPIPNVHLIAGSGITEKGTDGTVPLFARGQLVANPGVWPLTLDGTAGLKHAVDPAVLAAIRKVRGNAFEPATRFDNVFQKAPRLVEWREIRGTPQERIEGLALIEKLLLPQAGRNLEDFGLRASPAAQSVLSTFPELERDPLQAQAALAFLLLKYRVSVTVTLGPSFDFIFDETATGGSETLPHNSVTNPPLAFDVCHQGHRSGQAVMWNRLYRTIDGLIALLKAEDFGDGTSFWDRTMIYVASDFGREKHRPESAEDWPTGHDLNNGVMVFSPLVPGDTLRGGVEASTGKTFGFDPVTGAPEPGRHMQEAEIFGGLLHALGVDTEGAGLPDMPSLRA